jgi:ribosome-associated heat shock protein Hsp15
VRLYKTRGLASDACTAGHIQVNGHLAKPARPVRAGDQVIACTGDLTRTVKVLDVLERRIGPKLVSHYLEDLTPPSEYTRAREKSHTLAGARPKGSGRPTKKERRILGSFFGLEE